MAWCTTPLKCLHCVLGISGILLRILGGGVGSSVLEKKSVNRLSTGWAVMPHSSIALELPAKICVSVVANKPISYNHLEPAIKQKKKKEKSVLKYADIWEGEPPSATYQARLRKTKLGDNDMGAGEQVRFPIVSLSYLERNQSHSGA